MLDEHKLHVITVKEDDKLTEAKVVARDTVEETGDHIEKVYARLNGLVRIQMATAWRDKHNTEGLGDGFDKERR
jgi:hypothetical protein